MDATTIANLMISGVMILLCINLIPMLINPTTQVPWWNSLVTSLGVFTLAIAFALLGLWLSMLTSAIQGSLWLFVMIVRPVRKP